MRKPVTCHGCPFFEVSRDIVPDEIREGAEVFIIGQNPGAEEEAQGKPFVGKTGAMMEAIYLRKANLSREQVSLGNIIRCRYGRSNELPPYTEKKVKEAIAHCTSAHLKIPPSTRVIVSQGDYAAIGLTGEPVGEWRGYLRPLGGEQVEEPWVPSSFDPLPVLVTSHLARLFRTPALIIPTQNDWVKVQRYLTGTWPRMHPAFAAHRPDPWPRMIAFDTEYHHDSLIRWSISWGPGEGETYVEEGLGEPWPLKSWGGRVITQYAPADIRWLQKLNRDFDPFEAYTIEDTVWKHAVLWGDQEHSLNYLASIYSPFNRHKHLADTNPTLYSGLDALVLWHVDQALERELTADPNSRKVWETIDRPAIPLFVKAQYRGLRTDQARVTEVQAQLKHQSQRAQEQAQAIVGWPINLGSNPQVAHRLYTEERLKHA